MITIEGYLHYYEDDQTILRDIKQNMTKQWYATQHKKNRRLLNEREKELNKELTLNFKDVEAGLNQVFSGDFESSDVTLKGESITGPRGGNYDASSVSQDIVKMLSKNSSALTEYVIALGKVLNTIDDIHEKFHIPSITALLAAHAENPDAEISQLLNELNNQGISLNQGQIEILLSSYKTLYNNLIQLENFHMSNAGQPAKTKEMQILLQSIKGSLNGIKGILAEGEAFAGLADATIKGHNEVLLWNTGNIKGIANIKNDPRIKADKSQFQNILKQLESIQLKGKDPHSDLMVRLGGEKGYGYVGISVKSAPKNFNLNAVLNKHNFSQTLGLGSKTNLYNQIINVKGKLQQLTDVDPILYGQQAFGVHRFGKSGKQSGTASWWEDYLDAVAVLNVVDRLAGEGGFANFSRFLVVNGLLYSVDDILLEISKNPDQVYGFSIIQYIGRGINKWRKPEKEETNQDAAIRRSDEAKNEMIEVWKAASLQTKIYLGILNNLNQ